MSLAKTIEDNEIIFQINEKIAELKALIAEQQENGSKSILLSKFEELKIDIIYDDGATVGAIVLDESDIAVTVGGKTTRINRDGDVVQ